MGYGKKDENFEKHRKYFTKSGENKMKYFIKPRIPRNDFKTGI